MPTREEQLAELRQGAHVAHFYSEPSEAIAAAVPFLAGGLARGEQCFYITGECAIDRTLAALVEAGVDVAAEQARAALVFQRTFDVPASQDCFHFEAVYDSMRRIFDQAIAQGFTGMRLVADMTWTLAAEDNLDWLVAYEALGNHLLETTPLTAMCQYDRNRFAPTVVRDMLRTHPMALVDGQVCQNLYYERPDLALDPNAVDERVEWMLAQLARAQRAADEHVALVREQIARAAAEEAHQRLQEFLGMVVHELGNALTTIVCCMKIVRRRLPAELPAAFSDAEGRVRRLLGDLRDASQIGSGYFAVEGGPVDLAAIARHVAAQQAAAAQRRVIVDGPKELPGMWDRERISQVLTNLVSNALKYSPPGSEVCITVDRRDGNAMLRVADRGQGIAPDQLTQLFQPFSRLHRESGVKGTGLGLYICKGIVKAHGGRIWAESTPGKGSVFCVELPLPAEQDMAPNRPGQHSDDAVLAVG